MTNTIEEMTVAEQIAALPRVEPADEDNRRAWSTWYGDCGQLRFLANTETGYAGVVLTGDGTAGPHILRRGQGIPEWMVGLRGMWVHEGATVPYVEPDADEREAYLDSLPAREITLEEGTITRPFLRASDTEQAPYGYAGLAFFETEQGFEVTSAAITRHGLDPRARGATAYWVPNSAVQETYEDIVASLPVHRATRFNMPRTGPVMREEGWPFFARPEGYDYPSRDYTGILISDRGDGEGDRATMSTYGWLPQWIEGHRFFWAQETEPVAVSDEDRARAWYESLPVADLRDTSTGAGSGRYRIPGERDGSYGLSLRMHDEDTGSMWQVGSGHMTPGIPAEYHPYLRGWWLPQDDIDRCMVQSDPTAAWLESLPEVQWNDGDRIETVRRWTESVHETEINTVVIGRGPFGVEVNDNIGENYQVPREHWNQGLGLLFVPVSQVTVEDSAEEESVLFHVGDWFTWGTRTYWYEVAELDGNNVRSTRYWGAGGMGETDYLRPVVDFAGDASFRIGGPDSDVLPMGLREALNPPEVDPRIAELEARNAELMEQLTAAQEERDRVREHYSQDLATIGNLMSEEADEREWCDEYESVMRSINSAIHGEIETYGREQEYTVTIQGTVESTWQRTITVMAPRNSDSDDLVEHVEAYLQENQNYNHNIEITYSEHPGDSRDDWEIQDYS